MAFSTFVRMVIEFFKYQGTGNDFVIIDNRQQRFPKNDSKFVAQLCDLKFGVGADGLLILENHAQVDFTMVYYNADGNLSSMCGNGGRCIVHFAKHLGIISDTTRFEAVDGMHEAQFTEKGVSLKMNPVTEVKNHTTYAFLNTGSPHHVELVNDLRTYDVFNEGRTIREGIYGVEGANVNFVEIKDENSFAVRTYERGVEDETLSCGTGVTAVAIAMHAMGKTSESKVSLFTPGGTLTVSFEQTDTGYQNIFLEGPAVQVFKGNWIC